MTSCKTNQKFKKRITTFTALAFLIDEITIINIFTEFINADVPDSERTHMIIFYTYI